MAPRYLVRCQSGHCWEGIFLMIFTFKSVDLRVKPFILWLCVGLMWPVEGLEKTDWASPEADVILSAVCLETQAAAPALAWVSSPSCSFGLASSYNHRSQFLQLSLSLSLSLYLSMLYICRYIKEPKRNTFSPTLAGFPAKERHKDKYLSYDYF